MVFATNMLCQDPGMALFGLLPLVTGAFMAISPVGFSRVMRVLNRNGPGELIPQNDPARVEKSVLLRTQMRVIGSVMAIFGIMAIGRGFGLL
jgi:hypothetical protein